MNTDKAIIIPKIIKKDIKKQMVFMKKIIFSIAIITIILVLLSACGKLNESLNKTKSQSSVYTDLNIEVKEISTEEIIHNFMWMGIENKPFIKQFSNLNSYHASIYLANLSGEKDGHRNIIITAVDPIRTSYPVSEVYKIQNDELILCGTFYGYLNRDKNNDIVDTIPIYSGNGSSRFFLQYPTRSNLLNIIYHPTIQVDVQTFNNKPILSYLEFTHETEKLSKSPRYFIWNDSNYDQYLIDPKLDNYETDKEQYDEEQYNYMTSIIYKEDIKIEHVIDYYLLSDAENFIMDLDNYDESLEAQQLVSKFIADRICEVY